ncbi:hypothetical protein OBBRIDRAFT_516078 [Obba rivulosa]|uniref:Uncharacterized protein n=1 Tax=Obba rivulosa TaxID=1052685 RepID=A0A8E2DMW6_9APHY|nr:hypothetical protein OBBRIDRAFT_516078 [Obba rivulosa]
MPTAFMLYTHSHLRPCWTSGRGMSGIAGRSSWRRMDRNCGQCRARCMRDWTDGAGERLSSFIVKIASAWRFGHATSILSTSASESLRREGRFNKFTSSSLCNPRSGSMRPGTGNPVTSAVSLYGTDRSKRMERSILPYCLATILQSSLIVDGLMAL